MLLLLEVEIKQSWQDVARTEAKRRSDKQRKKNKNELDARKIEFVLGRKAN